MCSFQQPFGTSHDHTHSVSPQLRTPSLHADDDLPQAQLDRAASALRSQFGECVASSFSCCCLGHPTSYFCRCNRHTSSVLSDSSPFSKLFVTTVFVTTADTTTLSLLTPSLIVQRLTSIRSDSSSTRFPAVGRSTLRVLPPPRLIHSFSSTLILFMFLHFSSCIQRHIFIRF